MTNDLADRLNDVANGAFGPLPVQSADGNLTAIELGIFEQRKRISELEISLRGMTTAYDRVVDEKRQLEHDVESVKLDLKAQWSELSRHRAIAVRLREMALSLEHEWSPDLRDIGAEIATLDHLLATRSTQ